MAKFIEYEFQPPPWWNTLLITCVGMVSPLLAVILFLKGVVSTIGFVVIIACGTGVFFLLYEQVQRRSDREAGQQGSGTGPILLS